MPTGLVRYQQCGCFHSITFGCYHRFQNLGTAAARELFEHSAGGPGPSDGFLSR
jgi:hypothetical protein